MTRFPTITPPLRWIVEEADAIIVEGHVWLFMDCPPALLEYLAAFEASEGDDEDNGDDEPEGQEP